LSPERQLGKVCEKNTGNRQKHSQAGPDDEKKAVPVMTAASLKKNATVSTRRLRRSGNGTEQDGFEGNDRQT
jgi:hypothetical protein